MQNNLLPCYSLENLNAIPIIFIAEEDFADWINTQTLFIQHWTASQYFSGKPETYCQIPSAEGKLEKILVGTSHHFYSGYLAKVLPFHCYRLEIFNPAMALAWGMGSYQFTAYKKIASQKFSPLVIPPQGQETNTYLTAIYLVRDLINTPAQDMTPSHLAEYTKKLAWKFKAKFSEIIGEDLLSQHYPAIHAVGRASIHLPRLIDFCWGDENAPKITLVGKGVCFDTGGLDIKTAAGMMLMKKDMGGAAHVLGLAYLIMSFNLPVRLRVLIPAVENSIGSNAYRPGDIISTRKGISVEIGNTDAEGRLILCDALTEAADENPEILIDFATLTGAARIATGTEIPAIFTSHQQLASALLMISEEISDPLWQLPLYQPYRKLLDSCHADINNSGGSQYAGAITAALFLKEFVPSHLSWLHVDMMAWNLRSSPAHPEGGEAQGIRTVFSYLQRRFSARSSVG